MDKFYTTFAVVAHQDDWQLFMGSDVFTRLRDPLCRVVIVIATAGNGRHPEYHWKSRLSGAVLSLCRALPSWSPYSLGETDAAPLPSFFSVAYDTVNHRGKTILQCQVRSEQATRASLYMLHIAEPLSALRAGGEGAVLWPPDAAPYRSWDEFVETLERILIAEKGEAAGPVPVFTADLDESVNPGDHPDHLLTAQAVCEIAARSPWLRPVFYSMYANKLKPANLEGRQAADQRAAIYAYGGGYMAAAAGFGETWRTSWEHEYPVFRDRQYSRVESDSD